MTTVASLPALKAGPAESPESDTTKICCLSSTIHSAARREFNTTTLESSRGLKWSAMSASMLGLPVCKLKENLKEKMQKKIMAILLFAMNLPLAVFV